MNIDQERKDFEAAHVGCSLAPDPDNPGGYRNHAIQDRWEGWQARATQQEQATAQDSALLDYLSSDACTGYGLVTDDEGRWALTDCGMAPVPPEGGFTETVSITSIVDPEMWQDSPRAAIEARHLTEEAQQHE